MKNDVASSCCLGKCSRISSLISWLMKTWMIFLILDVSHIMDHIQYKKFVLLYDSIYLLQRWHREKNYINDSWLGPYLQLQPIFILVDLMTLKSILISWWIPVHYTLVFWNGTGGHLYWNLQCRGLEWFNHNLTRNGNNLG